MNNNLAPYDSIGNIMAFESGELDHDEIIQLFQHLVDTGLVWRLQGCYGRQAMQLIASGEVTGYSANPA